MSKQTVKNIDGIGRSISKEITTIERATPSIIYFESRVQSVESGLAANGVIDSTQDDRLEALEALEIPSGTPIGTVIAWSSTSPPSGYLECRGSYLLISQYPQLYAIIGHAFDLAGDTDTTRFRIPDLRGEFIRGWNNDDTVDAGRGFGSFQNYQYTQHRHLVTDSIWTPQVGPDTPGDEREPRKLRDYGDPQTYSNHWSSYAGGTNNSSETRPRNVALMYCIKAYDVVVNQSALDLSALQQQVTTNTDDIEALNNADAIWDTKLFSGNGYQKLPSGLILQWAQVPVNYNQTAITHSFPIPFDNACLSVTASVRHNTAIGGTWNVYVSGWTQNDVTLIGEYDSAAGSGFATYFAIGY